MMVCRAAISKREIRGNSRAIVACFLIGLLSVGVAIPAWGSGSGQGAAVRDPRWAILVAGVSGDPDLQKRYWKDILELRGVLEGSLGFSGSQIVVLFDNPALDPARIQYQSTRETLERVCKNKIGRVGNEDTVFIFLEGHGSYDGQAYKLNLVGPDPTGEDLAAMFYSIPAQRFVVVNATSCSGASLEPLAGKGRVVLTATKSGNEKNITNLARHFIDAFAGNTADVDKNGRVSIFEAFQYAARKVEEYYAREGSLQTEHPMLSDNGDAEALSLADAGARSNLLARSSYLDRGSPLLMGDGSPESQALAQEAQSLERQIELLKSAKEEMTEAEYEKRLETLLLKLAVIQAKLRKK
jgi:hypothetical protein